MHTFRFHIFTWGTALLLVVLPGLIHKSFGSAGEGNWCWIRGDELVSKIVFHDSVLLLATAAFIVSCILAAVKFVSSSTKVLLQDLHYMHASLLGVARSIVDVVGW